MSGPSTYQGFLAKAIAANVVQLVGINEVKFLEFGLPGKGHPVTLGVKGLRACSVVAILSERGAILAHVGPNVLGSTAHDSYITLAKTKMAEMARLYRSNKSCFGVEDHAYLVCATFGGKEVSSKQIEIFRESLTEMGVPLVGEAAYERSPAVFINDKRPEGTVWIVKENRPRARPFFYLEDGLVTPKMQANTSRASNPEAGPSQGRAPMESPQASSSADTTQ